MLSYIFTGPASDFGRATAHNIEVFSGTKCVAKGVSMHMHANSATVIRISSYELELLSEIEALFNDADAVVFNYS